MSTTTTTTREMTLGPLTAVQRTEIMRFAPAMSVEARQVFRRLLVLRQESGLRREAIARAAAQATAHFEL